MPGETFVRRFAQHILPAGFRKIRHYGLLAPGNVKTRLPLARTQLLPDGPPEAPPPEDVPDTGALERLDPPWMDLPSALLGRDLRCCRRCGAPTVVLARRARA